MSRRQQIRAAMNGGTTAPAPTRRDKLVEQISGIRRRPGGARKPSASLPGVLRAVGAEGIRRPPGGGRQAIERSASGATRSTGPLYAPKAAAGGGPTAVASAAQPALGRQLSRRVAAGEITQQQAEQTARERGELKRAYGSDWRQQVFGEDLQNLRLALAGAHKGDPRYEAALKAVLAGRKSALTRARTKFNGGTTAPPAA